MKKLFTLFSLCFIAIAAQAQLATVTGTIIDQSTTVWAKASVTATFAPTPGKQGPFTWSGGAYQTTVSTMANASGVFSIALAPNTQIVPALSTWQIQICPQVTASCIAFNYQVTVTADISSLITSNAAPIQNVPATPLPLIYNNAEVGSIPLNQGALVYDTTLRYPKYWDGSSWNPFGTGGGGGNAVVTNPTAGQTVIQNTVSNVQTELDVNAFNGWRDISLFSGATTAAKVVNTYSTLTNITGVDGSTNKVGPMVIPPYETRYNSPGDGSGTNPMLTDFTQGASIHDERATSLTGWPAGGELISNGQDWCSANWYYFGKRAQMEVCNDFNASLYPNDILGMVGISSNLNVYGTPQGSDIQAEDALAAVASAMPGVNTSTTRTFITPIEADAEIVGNQTGSTPGSYINLYDFRAITASLRSQNPPATDNGVIGAYANYVSQQVNFTPASTFHFNATRGIWSTYTGVSENSVYVKRTATFTNGSNQITWVSGDYFNDEAEITLPEAVCSAASCQGLLSNYNVIYSGSPTTATIYPAYSGTSGNYQMFGNGFQWTSDLNANTHFDTSNYGTAMAWNDPHGGNGVLMDLALTNCPGGNPNYCMLWLRNPNLAALKPDGSYPRMGLAPDNYGNLLFYQPSTGNFTGSVAGSTLTVTTAPAIPLAVGQTIYGASLTPYSIASLGTGTGGNGTYILNGSQGTITSESMRSDGNIIVGSLSTLTSGAYAGLYNWTVTGGIFATGADTTLRGVSATIDPSAFATGTTIGGITTTGNGAGITTGPTTTIANHCVIFANITGAIGDSGAPCGTGGGGGSGTVNTATIYSPTYYGATGNAVNGVTPFTGMSYFSTAAAPRAAIYSDVENTLSQDTAATNIPITGVSGATTGQGCLQYSSTGPVGCLPGTQVVGAHYFQGDSGTTALAAGTATITLSGAYAAIPACVATDTTALALVKPVATISSATVTLVLTGTGTDSINWNCTVRTQ